MLEGRRPCLSRSADGPGRGRVGVRGGGSGPAPPRRPLLTGHDGVEALQLVERFTVQQLHLQKLNPGLGLLETQENDLFRHLPLRGAPRNQGPCLIPPAVLAGTRSARLLWGGFPPGMACLVVKAWAGVWNTRSGAQEALLSGLLPAPKPHRHFGWDLTISHQEQYEFCSLLPSG